MKKTLLVISTAMTIALSNVLISTSGCTSGVNEENAHSITNSYAILPLDIDSQAQKVADIFSWETFIAMNWPGNPSTCGPDTSYGASILSSKGPVVWETYLSSDQVFVAAPHTPAGWCEGSLAHIPKRAQDLAKQTGVYRFIHRTSKSPHSLDEALGGPLVDQNGRFVRYEVRMNYDEYNYITTNKLWDTAGQTQFTKQNTVVMPGGPTSYGPVGAMEIKAAWKVLGNGDDASKFYTIKAIVYNDDSLEASPGDNPLTLGLVGLHIARKTATQRNWVWSTFEQVDNLTTSFYNPKCDTCPENQPLSGTNFKELGPDGKPLHLPTQVTRVNAIDDPYTDTLNKYYQTLLKGSVWANYQLVSTQWLFFENMAPLFLANSVQETYLQGPNPPSYGGFKLQFDQPYYTDTLYNPFAQGISSSCMGCHFVATLPGSDAKADFSFLLGEAK